MEMALTPTQILQNIDDLLPFSGLSTKLCLTPEIHLILWGASVWGFENMAEPCSNVAISFFLFTTSLGIVFGYEGNESRVVPGLFKFKKMSVQNRVFKEEAYLQILPGESWYYNSIDDQLIDMVIYELEVFSLGNDEDTWENRLFNFLFKISTEFKGINT